jgi:uroporphyrinogen decarboxylase
MTKREVVRAVLKHQKPPYVPWQFSFTREAEEKLRKHYRTDDLDTAVGNHFVGLGNDIGFFTEEGPGLVRDAFGSVWDRTVDKDIGVVKKPVLPGPALDGYTFPNPEDPRFFDDIPGKLEKYPESFRVFSVGFSLFERAWSMRGMEKLLMDFLENPDFVHQLMNAIGEYNLAHIKKAMTYDIDAVLIGDDWGQQSGLIMGPKLWYAFIEPHLKKMFTAIKDSGKFVMIHSCGDVDELFDHLVAIGLDCFNPFQPEAMDPYILIPEYRDELSFWGGLSTQKTLPYGKVNDVKVECERLLRSGVDGGYIFAPAHAVESDVPLENMLAFIEMAQ